MYDLFEESETDHEALSPQLNRNRPIHNEIRTRVLSGHVLAEPMVEFQACKAGTG